MGFMKKCLLMLVLLFCIGCNVQKHLEVEKVSSTQTELKVDETNNRNTTRFIVITKYQTVKDSTTGNYPVESVTEIKEVNNDVVTTKTEEKKEIDEEETIKEDKVVKSDWKIYLWCFLGGIGFMLLLMFIGWLIKLYIKKGV